MKKLLGIVALGLFLSMNAYAKSNQPKITVSNEFGVIYKVSPRYYFQSSKNYIKVYKTTLSIAKDYCKKYSKNTYAIYGKLNFDPKTNPYGLRPRMLVNEYGDIGYYFKAYRNGYFYVVDRKTHMGDSNTNSYRFFCANNENEARDLLISNKVNYPFKEKIPQIMGSNYFREFPSTINLAKDYDFYVVDLNKSFKYTYIPKPIKIVSKERIEEIKKKGEKKKKPKKIEPKVETPKVDNDKIVAASSGTGFFVSKTGHLISNHHVVEGCNIVKLTYKGKEITADILAIDKMNDLAILKADLTPSKVYSVETEDASLLEDIIIAGYPLGKKVSAAIKTSKGSVTALAGYGDNYSEFQTDAALNKGNSGGPIINQKGNIIGVAVANFGKEAGIESFNFGIKSSTLKTFAKANGLNFLPPNNRNLSNKDLGKLITEATIYLECHMTVAKIKRMIAKEKNRKAFFSEY